MNIFDPNKNTFIPWGCVIILIIFSTILGYSLPDWISSFDGYSIYGYLLILIADIWVLIKWNQFLELRYRRKRNFHISFDLKYIAGEKSRTEKVVTKHINIVMGYMRYFINNLSDRADVHDESLLSSPESDELNKIGISDDTLKESTISVMKIAEHHYASNDHHIEHYKNGVKGMNLLSILEYLANIKSTTLYGGDDIYELINKASNKYSFSDDLRCILINTAELLFKYRIVYENEKTNYRRVYTGDTLQELQDDIFSDENTSDIEKYYIKYGPNDEFLDHDYRSRDLLGYKYKCSYFVNDFKAFA